MSFNTYSTLAHGTVYLRSTGLRLFVGLSHGLFRCRLRLLGLGFVLDLFRVDVWFILGWFVVCLKVSKVYLGLLLLVLVKYAQIAKGQADR